MGDSLGRVLRRPGGVIPHWFRERVRRNGYGRRGRARSSSGPAIYSGVLQYPKTSLHPGSCIPGCAISARQWLLAFQLLGFLGRTFTALTQAKDGGGASWGVGTGRLAGMRTDQVSAAFDVGNGEANGHFSGKRSALGSFRTVAAAR